MKSIAAGVIALFLLIGTVGVGVFSHVCEEDGLEVSYFVPNDEVCDDHGHDNHHQDEKEAHHEDPCCCDEGSESDGCCSVSIELVKLHLEFLNKLEVKAILNATTFVAPVWIVDTPLVSTDVQKYSGTDPPPQQGKEILIDIQQWLI